MTQVDIAVCIPSKNRAPDIACCLRSIAAQEVAPAQIIVVDQSDTKYDFPPMPGLIHVYDPRISGSAAARNVGWGLVNTEITFYIDDDVELLPNCLNALADAASKHPEVVGFQCAIEGGETRITWTKIHAMIFHRGFFNAAKKGGRNGRELRVLSGCAAAIRSNLRDQVPFDESLVGYSYGEDWEFSHRARTYGPLVLVPEAKLLHNASPINRFKREQLLRDRWDNFLYFYDKLNAKKYWPNRFWRIWWMLGESIHWMRFGMGCPMLGIRTKRAPKGSLTLHVKNAR